MFYLPHAVAIWIISIWLIEWRRLRELLVFALWGAMLGQTEDTVGHRLGFWTYHDSGLFDTHFMLSMLIGLSAAPLLSMYFVQGLSPDRTFPWRRILAFTTICILPELTAFKSGHIAYGHGWNIVISYFAHLPTWISLHWLHRWLHGPASRVTGQT